MQNTPVTASDLAGSVIAVPPLCRNTDLTLNPEENQKLISHIEAGGVRILLFGGNANLYHIAPSEYPHLLDLLENAAGGDTIVVPSVGPAYGTMLDQAAILRNRGFPTAMVLPTLFPHTGSGVQTAVRHFVEKAGAPAVLYMKNEGYLTAAEAAQLVDDGLVSFIKYAVVRDDPATDPLLSELVDLVSTDLIVSGIGEQPTIAHLRKFNLNGFTSGCVCVRPDKSMQVLNALKNDDLETAQKLITGFFPLEDLRNTHGPIPVLHHAVAGAGIASTGPLYPLLTELPEPLTSQITKTAQALLNS